VAATADVSIADIARPPAMSFVNVFIILIMFGLMLQAGLSIVTVKLFFIVVFILLTTPAAAHALAKAALHGEVKPLLQHSGDES